MPSVLSRFATRPGSPLAVAVEGPGQHRRSHRDLLALGGGPSVPSLIVAVHLALHQLLLRHAGKTGRDELAAEDLAVVGVPVLPLASRQGLEDFSEMMYSTPVMLAAEVLPSNRTHWAKSSFTCLQK